MTLGFHGVRPQNPVAPGPLPRTRPGTSWLSVSRTDVSRPKIAAVGLLCVERIFDRCAWRPTPPVHRKLSRSGNKLCHESRCVVLPDVATLVAGCRNAGEKRRTDSFRRLPGCRVTRSRTGIHSIRFRCSATARITPDYGTTLTRRYRAEIKGPLRRAQWTHRSEKRSGCRGQTRWSPAPHGRYCITIFTRYGLAAEPDGPTDCAAAQPSPLLRAGAERGTGGTMAGIAFLWRHKADARSDAPHLPLRHSWSLSSVIGSSAHRSKSNDASVTL